MTSTNNNKFIVVDATELSPEEIAFTEQFGGKVIGQPGALKVAQLAYNMARNPLRDRTRPIGIFYLAGPSRTGKSLTGVTLAEIFHNDPEALTRIQASDYTEDHQLLELKGAPPSYIGFRDPKDPKNKLEDHEIDPYSVVSPHNLKRVRLNSGEVVDIVVIEEFEKSSADFYKFWMGVFDKGVARLGNGMVADFRNTIFILTSNIGMDRFEKEKKGNIGFVKNDTRSLKVDDVVHEEMMRAYKPEFRNRLDAVVVFQPFTHEQLTLIVDSELAVVRKRISEEMEATKDFMIDVTAEAKQFMLRSVNNNVAELKRVINRDLLMPLGRLLSTKKVNGGDIVRVSVKSDDSGLEFAVAKNGLGIGEHEHAIRKMGKRAGTARLGLQREVRKARLTASAEGVQEWSVITRGEDREDMMKVAVDLINTMENVLELEVVSISYHRVAPFIFQAIVRASKSQINLLCQLHDEDGLMVNPTATKALPAPRD